MVIAAACIAVLVVTAEVSGSLLAAPAMAVSLRASQSQVQWILDLYTLVLVAVVLPAGAIADRIGRRRAFLVGLIVLAAASAAGAATHSGSAMMATRALAGLGAGILLPATLATITAVLPPDRRDRAGAIWGAAFAAGGFVGGLAAAGLLSFSSWRAIFVFLAVASLAVAVLTRLVIPESTAVDTDRLDVVGVLLTACCATGLVYAVIEAPVAGWLSRAALSGFAVSGLAATALIRWINRTRSPIVDPALFRDHRFATGMVSMFVQYLVAYGSFLIAIELFVTVRGDSPMRAVLVFVPFAAVGPAAVLSSRAIQRAGPAIVGAVGLLVAAGSMVAFERTRMGSGSMWSAVGALLLGVGIGLATAPATGSILDAVPRGRLGVASALNDAVREMGAAVGIAVAGSAFNTAYRSDIAHHAQSLPPGVVATIKSSPAAGMAIGRAAQSHGLVITAAVRAAFGSGWAHAMWTMAAFACLGSALVLMLDRLPQAVASEADEETARAVPSTTSRS